MEGKLLSHLGASPGKLTGMRLKMSPQRINFARPVVQLDWVNALSPLSPF